jgi:hypothetical protein
MQFLAGGGIEWALWDESLGAYTLSTGIGAKTLALTIDASQDSTFAGTIKIADAGPLFTLQDTVNLLATTAYNGHILWQDSAAATAALIGFASSSNNDMDIANYTTTGEIHFTTNSVKQLEINAAGLATFTAGVTVLGAFTSLGIDDNANSEMLQLADNLAGWGPITAGFGFTHYRVADDDLLAISGGASGSSGSNIRLYGGTHATANDAEFRAGSNIWQKWDESLGSLAFYTGTGVKTTALTIASNQNVTISERLFVAGGSDETYTTLDHLVVGDTTGSHGMIVVSSATGTGRYAFGDTALKGGLEYDHTNSILELHHSGFGVAPILTLATGVITFSQNAPTLLLESSDTTVSDGTRQISIDFRTNDVSGAGVAMSIDGVGNGSTGLLNMVFRAGTIDAPELAMTISSTDQSVTLASHIDVGTEILLTERADHVFTPVASIGGLWLRDDSSLMFTDGAGTDHDLIGKASGLISGAYTFSSSTAITPATGTIRFDTALYSTVTELFIADTTSGGSDATNFLAALVSGDQIYIQNTTDAAVFSVWTVSAAVTDEGTWFRVPVSEGANGTFPSNNNKMTMTLSFGAVGGALAGGADTELQYNNGGALGGMAEWTYNSGTGALNGTGNFSSSGIDDNATLTITRLVSG